MDILIWCARKRYFISFTKNLHNSYALLQGKTYSKAYFHYSLDSVYSNSRNDVPRVAQRYGTIAAHTRRRASVLVVLVVFCVYMHSFAGLIRRTPPPTFSDTAITDRHSDTTIFQLRAHWVRISWSIFSDPIDHITYAVTTVASDLTEGLKLLGCHLKILCFALAD